MPLLAGTAEIERIYLLCDTVSALFRRARTTLIIMTPDVKLLTVNVEDV